MKSWERGLLFALGIASLALWLTGARSKAVLRVGRLEVVDSQSNVVAVLAPGPGGGFLRLQGLAKGAGLGPTLQASAGEDLASVVLATAGDSKEPPRPALSLVMDRESGGQVLLNGGPWRDGWPERRLELTLYPGLQPNQRLAITENYETVFVPLLEKYGQFNRDQGRRMPSAFQPRGKEDRKSAD
jgi:hypothetical protein